MDRFVAGLAGVVVGLLIINFLRTSRTPQVIIIEEVVPDIYPVWWPMTPVWYGGNGGSGGYSGGTHGGHGGHGGH